MHCKDILQQEWLRQPFDDNNYNNRQKQYTPEKGDQLGRDQQCVSEKKWMHVESILVDLF